jgi:hypothetical protein
MISFIRGDIVTYAIQEHAQVTTKPKSRLAR